jgi:formylglycine-generating enzyme required for sulfatase activity
LRISSADGPAEISITLASYLPPRASVNRLTVRAHFGAGWNDLRPVGSYLKGASPFDVLDMAGNGWECLSSAYLPYPLDR